jgi:hypothetical protein
MDDKEYQSDEYITDVIVTFIEATINKEHNYEAYKQAKEDLVKLIHEFKGGK